MIGGKWSREGRRDGEGSDEDSRGRGVRLTSSTAVETSSARSATDAKLLAFTWYGQFCAGEDARRHLRAAARAGRGKGVVQGGDR